MTPTPVFLPGESHGQRSLVGCPWGRSESDMTEATQHTRTQSILSFPGGSVVKNLLASAGEAGSRSLGPEYSPEKEMANHASMLAREIPWTEIESMWWQKESDTT